MRSLALERDDSVLPFSSLIALLAHVLLFFLVIMPPKVVEPPIDHVYSSVTSIAIFPGEQKFRVFSDRDRIFSDAQSSVTTPTSGTIVDPSRAPSREPVQRNTSQTQSPQSIENRRYYGNTADAQAYAEATPQASGGNNPAQGSYRSRISAPAEPEGMVESWEDRNRRALGFERSEQVGGTTGAPRSGNADPSLSAGPSGSRGGFTRGVLESPGRPLGINPTTPQRGANRNNPALEEPTSVGPNVSETARGGPRPSGIPTAPPSLYGARRIIYQPELHYPEWAERDRVQASPRFHIIVSPDGKVSSVRLAVSSGYPDLDRLAEENVRRWIYEKREGQTEARQIVVRFKLR